MSLKIENLTPPQGGNGQTKAYFRPDSSEVYAFTVIGSGIPMDAYHGRHLYLGDIPADTADTAPYRELLRAREGDIADIAAGYSVEWDGAQERGRLSEEAREILSSLQEAWADITSMGPPTYWQASEWLDPVWGQVSTEILKAESVEAWVSNELASACADGAYLDPDDLRETACKILEEFLEEIEEFLEEIEDLEEIQKVADTARKAREILKAEAK